MLSRATSAPAQGVGSVYLEMMSLMEKYGKGDFEIYLNRHSSKMDLYHVHSINPTFYFMMKKKRTTICFVHFMPDTLEGSIRLPKLIFRLFRKYVVSFYKKAKEIVVVNPSFKKELVQYGLKEERISYIPNFVSSSQFYPMEQDRKKELRKEYGIPDDAFVILGVGQVQTRKGVLDFIRMSEENPDKYFIWAGGFSFKNITDGYSQLKTEMDKKRKNLKFLGIVDRDRMNEVYNLADVFVLPSYSELFPMALLEAGSSSVPYIVRDLQEYRPILPGDYNRAKTVEEFNVLLMKLKDNEAFYRKSVELSLELSKKYNEEAVYQMWKDYYWKIYEKYNQNT